MDNSFNRLRGTSKWEEIARYARDAEQYVQKDPSVALFKLRLFAETMTDEIFRIEEIPIQETEKQVDRIKILEERQIIPADIAKIFHNIRKAGNKAAHSGKGTTEEAKNLLKQASHLAAWFADRYIDNLGGNKQSVRENKQEKTASVKKKGIITHFRALLLFIPLAYIIWAIAGNVTGVIVTIIIVLYMIFRFEMLQERQNTTILTILLSFFVIAIGFVGMIFHISNSSEGLQQYITTVPGKNIIVDLNDLEDYATVYVNDQPIDTKEYLGNQEIKIGSKVHVEWDFPWGKMKSEPQEVDHDTRVMKFMPQIDEELKKELTDFFNEFAKQCVKARRVGDPHIVTLVSEDIGYMCTDEKEQELIETGIDFESSGPKIFETFRNDPVLIFGLRAYFRCAIDGETQTHSGYFRLIYHEKLKSWSIKNRGIDGGQFGPETVRTKFD